jgi:hypothetical protein
VKNLPNLSTSLLNKFSIGLCKSQVTKLKTLFAIICTILVKETVNLNKLKNQLGYVVDKPDTQTDSHYRRLTRFFNDRFCRFSLWKLILKTVMNELVQRIDKRSRGLYILIDGTSWEFGQTKFHFLTLSLVYQGVSIPFFFVNLGKKGLSNLNERRRTLKMANLIYPLKGMTLIADREYIGRDWFIALEEEFKMGFIIRLAESKYKKEFDEQQKYYGEILKKIRRGKVVDIEIAIRGRMFRFIGKKNPNPENADDDVLPLLTNLRSNKNKIIAQYGIRWQIECLFKCLKTNGFNMEDLGLKDPAKVRLMISIIVACYVLCVCEGIKNLKKIAVRKKTQTKYESIFRNGYSKVVVHSQKVALFLAWLIKDFGKIIRPKPA